MTDNIALLVDIQLKRILTNIKKMSIDANDLEELIGLINVCNITAPQQQLLATAVSGQVGFKRSTGQLQDFTAVFRYLTDDQWRQCVERGAQGDQTSTADRDVFMRCLLATLFFRYWPSHGH